MLITQLIVEEESSIDSQAYWVSFRSTVMTGEALFRSVGSEMEEARQSHSG
jgi:hypothetical protein